MVGLRIDIPTYAIDFDKAAVRKVFRQAAQEVAADARRLIRETMGTGAKRGSHTASAPGQPPANMTGKLASSIRLSSRNGRDGSISITITDSTPYALALEAGAAGGGGKKGSGNPQRSHKSRSFEERVKAAIGNRILEPRPFLSTALENKEQSLTERVQASIMKGVEFRRQK